ncbi:MAG: DNA-3-methyladenine glycosylase [Nanoarchaeota archaeon]
MKLGKDFFSRDAEVVARDLLGKILSRKQGKKILKARVVETEAYFDEKDPASRACKNGNLRETMKMQGGTILVYGVHNNWLINFVTGEKGKAEAVLIRALEPLNFNARASGPGLLCKALGIDKNFHGKSILNNKELWIEYNKEKFNIVERKRIGIKKDLSKELRFYIDKNKFISKK